jgi:subtilisin family serine protease
MLFAVKQSLNKSLYIMKRNCILVLFFLCCIGGNAQQQTSDKHFYYYKGEKYYLRVDYSRLSIVSEGKFVDSNKTISQISFSIGNEEKSYTKQNVRSVENISVPKMYDNIYISEMKFDTILNEKEYSLIIQRLLENDNIIKVLPVYIVFNKKVGISNNFYVKLFKREDISVLFDLAEKYSMHILGANEYMPLWFTLSCTKETPFSSIDAANKFYETHLFECAEPELLYYDLQASTDPYFPDQWGLKNTGQYGGISGLDIKAEQAWTITTGYPNIRVAIYDHGFEMNHPDLVNNVYGTGYDATTNTAPAQVRGEHGTACAGIAGAQQNNAEGISGVSPDSKLISISINLLFSDTPQQLANGFNWARQNGADVISNSWGGYAPSSVIDDAISSVLTQGRNGMGTVVVFASGNEDDTNIRYPGNSNPDILVVGAMSPCGERKNPNSCDTESSWGSCYGTQLDVVAPGVLIPTADRQGTNGYNPYLPIHPLCGGTKLTSDYSNQDYTVWFNGTSSACPHVAGVAALVLSVNPTLTGQQVRDIIERTAQKVRPDLYTYSTISGHPNGTWNNEMGYGLVDAYAAVQLASCIRYLHDQTITSNTTVMGCDINVWNVTVTPTSSTPNPKLTLDSTGDTLIESNFEVQLGAELEIK